MQVKQVGLTLYHIQARDYDNDDVVDAFVWSKQPLDMNKDRIVIKRVLEAQIVGGDDMDDDFIERLYRNAHIYTVWADNIQDEEERRFELWKDAMNNSDASYEDYAAWLDEEIKECYLENY